MDDLELTLRTSINHVDGGGVSQMTILLNKPYFVKVTMKEFKNTLKFDYVVYG